MNTQELLLNIDIETEGETYGTRLITNTQELISSVNIEAENAINNTRLSYYLLSQKPDSCEESVYDRTYGVKVEEKRPYWPWTAAQVSEVKDICPIRDEVIDFIRILKDNQVTGATLYDVAYDWVSER